jgi:BTB/POZ domain
MNFFNFQSGYFKSVFLQQSPSSTSASSSSSSSVTLPTVPAEYFSILLNGMYSGTFNVTNENVYQVSVNVQHLAILQTIGALASHSTPSLLSQTTWFYNPSQRTLTEGEGSVQLTSLYQLVKISYF